jgi:2'-5' RNA ligase/GNAT superfamily N-acetyltransferase
VVLPDRTTAVRIDAIRQAIGDPHLRRIAPHITLIRPFNVADEQLDEVLDAVRAAASHRESRPIGVTLGPPRVFDTSDTLYMAVDERGTERLTALRELLRAGAMDLPEQYPQYVPHLTLARGVVRADLLAAALVLRACKMDTAIEYLTVFEMDAASVWHTLCDFVLARAAVSGRGGFEIEVTLSAVAAPDVEEFASRAWTEHDRELGIAWDRHDLTLVARRRGRVLGLASGWVDGGLGYLSSLIVEPPHRGEGIGLRLVEMFRSETAARGATRWAVRTFADTDAHRWYLRHGWTEETRFANWIEGRTFIQLRR